MDCLKMTKLQDLNVFLTERLMLAAQDIYKAVENTILEYQGEIIRERRENDQLKRKLRDAGIAWPEQDHFGPLEFEEEECFPLCKEQELQPSPTPEKRDRNTRNEETESRRSLDSKSTSHGNSKWKPDPTSVSSCEYQEYQCHLEERQEEDSMSSSPSNQIKAETEVPGACPAAPTDSAESLSLNPDCSSAQSKTSVSMTESDRLLSQFEAVQFPPHLFQIQNHDAPSSVGYAKPRRRFGHSNADSHTHTEDQAFLCGLCGKSFSSSGRLKGHQRIHTGEKPYQCHICTKRFNQTAHLKVHLRVHTGEKPFSCPVCGKSFTQSNKVKRHLVTHARD